MSPRLQEMHKSKTLRLEEIILAKVPAGSTLSKGAFRLKEVKSEKCYRSLVTSDMRRRNIFWILQSLLLRSEEV